MEAPFDLYSLAVARIVSVLKCPRSHPRPSAASLPALPTYTLSFVYPDASSLSQRCGQAFAPALGERFPVTGRACTKPGLLGSGYETGTAGCGVGQAEVFEQ